MSKVNLVFLFLILNIYCISAQENSDVPFGDAREEFTRIRLLAEKGDPDAAVQLWNSGSLIDKHEILRDVAPHKERLSLIKNAADAGQPEACFIYATHILKGKKPNLVDFHKFLGKSCEGNYPRSCIAMVLIENFYKGNAGRAESILSRLRKSVPKNPKNLFDNSITLKSVDLVEQSIDEKGLEWLRVEAESKDQSDLVWCIDMFDRFVSINSEESSK